MTDPVSTLPPWWAERLALLLGELGEVSLSPAERASLAVLAGQDPVTVLHLAAVLRRVRQSTPGGDPR